jgi:hypothetical protein
VTLARFRLCPVPWAGLVVLAVVWVPLARLAVTGPAEPEDGVTAFRMAALALGLGAAVLAAPETDPPRDLLRATPLAHWRALAPRLAGWLALATAALLAAARLAGTGGWTGAELALAAWPNLLLMSAACLLGAGPTSTLGGGAAGLAVVVALERAGRAWPELPLRPVDVPGGPGWAASQAWTVALGLALAAAALLLEARAGTRPGARRPSPSRSRRATEARARP